MEPFTISDEKLEKLLARELNFSELKNIKEEADEKLLSGKPIPPKCPYKFSDRENMSKFYKSKAVKDYKAKREKYRNSKDYQLWDKISFVFFEELYSKEWAKKVSDYSNTLNIENFAGSGSAMQTKIKPKEYLNFSPLQKIATKIAIETFAEILDNNFMSIEIDSYVMPILGLAMENAQETMNEISSFGFGGEQWNFGNEYHYLGFDWMSNELGPEVLLALFRVAPLSDYEVDQERANDIAYSRLNRWQNISFKSLVDDGLQDEIHYFSDTSYYGIELRSPGHRRICKRLEEMGIMFFFESPCKLLGDKKKYRRIDLIVVHNDRAVIVEIDGGTHRTVAQQRDDYERDSLIRKHWSKTLRIEHSDAFERTEEVIAKIMSELDPSSGSIK